MHNFNFYVKIASRTNRTRPVERVEGSVMVVKQNSEPRVGKSWWRRHWDLVVAGLIIAGVVVSALLVGKHEPQGNDSMFFDNHLYGKFVEFAGTPGGVRGEPISFDSLWGPVSKSKEVQVNDTVYYAGNCVGEGTQHVDLLGITGPYSSLVCYDK